MYEKQFKEHWLFCENTLQYFVNLVLSAIADSSENFVTELSENPTESTDSSTESTENPTESTDAKTKPTEVKFIALIVFLSVFIQPSVMNNEVGEQ